MGLFYANKDSADLVGYANAGYLSDPHKARSQTGYVLHVEVLSYHGAPQSNLLLLLLQIMLK